jgi:large subunit ribosomal protein L25
MTAPVSAASPASKRPPKAPKASQDAAVLALSASARVASGKSEAKKLRRAGQVPAVAYGKGLPSTPLAVAPKDILAILKSERGKNSVLKLSVDGTKDLLVMIRDYTYHPVQRDLEHVDFVEVKLDQEVDVDVPLFGLGKPVGVTAGGVIRVVYRTVPVRCLPEKIPLKIEIDIAHLELGQHIATQDLKLPEGVRVLLPAEQTLIAIVTPEKERVEEEVAAAVPGAVPGAAPAAGAAPGAAAPAGGAPGAAAPAAGAAKDAKAAAPAKEAKKK